MIVVNDGTIPVESVVADVNQAGRITLVNHDHNRGLAASRNTGLRLAKAPILPISMTMTDSCPITSARSSHFLNAAAPRRLLGCLACDRA